MEPLGERGPTSSRYKIQKKGPIYKGRRKSQRWNTKSVKIMEPLGERGPTSSRYKIQKKGPIYKGRRKSQRWNIIKIKESFLYFKEWKRHN
jgi:hypothetical protein